MRCRHGKCDEGFGGLTTQIQKIPLVQVEEHHEEFYVWNYAIKRGWLSPEGNTLLHVDEHSDMSIPRLRRPVNSINGECDLAEFTYGEIDIGNFIWPAVYQGIFNRILWLRRVHREVGLSRRMSICTVNPARTEFITGSGPAFSRWASAPDKRDAEFFTIKLSDAVKTDQPIVLDIDLDYFSCNKSPDYVDNEIEITQAAYEQFLTNRYHFLRIAPGSKASVEHRDGRFFLLFNDFPNAQPELASYEEIAERIATFITVLEKNSIMPVLAIIARSVESGYTPRVQYRWLEEKLLEALAELYPLQLMSMDDILPVVYRTGMDWAGRTSAPFA